MFTVGGFLCTSTKIKWDIAELQSYQFKIRMESKSEGGKLSLTGVSLMEINGILNYKYFGRNNDLIRIGFQLSPVKYTINGTEDKIISDFYSSPFIVEFTQNGDILKVYTEGISLEDSSLIEMLINPLKIVSKTAFWGKWSTVESDSSGLYSASYNKSFSETKKKRIKYLKYTDNENKRIQIKFISSENIFTQNNSCSWIQSFYSKEKIFFSNMDSNFISSIFYEMNYISSSLSETSKLNNFNNYDEAFKSITNNRKNNYSVKDRIRLDETKNELQKESVKSLISKLQSNQLSQNEFERKLADYLILNPDEANRIYDMIISSSIPQNIINSCLVAASMASTNQSQKVLIKVSSNPGINFNNRLQASVYIGELKKINIDTIRDIEIYSQNFQDQNTSLLSSAMLCSIGRLYGRQSKDYPSEEYDEIYRFFNQKLDTVKSTTDTCAVIRAIGNTEDSSFYNRINEYRTNSNDGFIRAAALSTLTKIDSNQAEEALIDSFKNDKDSTVVSEAIRLQTLREENPDFTKDVASRIVTETDPEIKTVMIDYFMTNGKNDPKVKESLLESLKSETDPDLRIKLHKAIYSKIQNKK